MLSTLRADLIIERRGGGVTLSKAKQNIRTLHSISTQNANLSTDLLELFCTYNHIYKLMLVKLKKLNEEANQTPLYIIHMDRDQNLALAISHVGISIFRIGENGQLNRVCPASLGTTYFERNGLKIRDLSESVEIFYPVASGAYNAFLRSL